jgi:hypothetical protein
MRELRGGRILSVTGGELLAMVQQARQFLVASGLVKRDRCVLLAPNSIRWAALDLSSALHGWNKLCLLQILKTGRQRLPPQPFHQTVIHLKNWRSNAMPGLNKAMNRCKVV